MESYKRGSRTVWNYKYHIVWVNKYRYKLLRGDVGKLAASYCVRQRADMR